MKTVNVGIIGMGAMGSGVARKLQPLSGVRLGAFCDVRGEVVRGLGEQYGAAPFTDFKKMPYGDLDAIFICTTNDWHADCVIAAAEGGTRNIFCEKPLARTLAEARSMVQAVEKRKIRTSMGFGGRRSKPIQYINSLLQSGKLGHLMLAQLSTYRGYGFHGLERVRDAQGRRLHHPAVIRPEMSGGWSVHHACHAVYWMTCIGGAVKEVDARHQRSSPKVPSEELACAMLSFASGATGLLVDCVGSMRSSWHNITGSRGTVEMASRKRKGAKIEVKVHLEGEDKEFHKSFPHDPNKGGLPEEFIAAIRHGRPSPVTFREGYENLRVCLAICESARSGRPVAVSRLPGMP